MNNEGSSSSDESKHSDEPVPLAMAVEVNTLPVLASTVTTLDLLSEEETVEPPGLTYKRKSYLYNKMREFVSEESKDILCPKPIANVNELSSSSNSSISTLPTTSVDYSFQKQITEKSTRQKPTCSYCKQIGHRNQVREGIYFCRKRNLDSQTE
ncbi:unnamed protein product [Parnassius apollo]|uniref:(apollo) hypothetical protein n=1 Tax=Parnassius apollo TaxID=110799 RepID=A0A8S3WRP0_PARAO|nr:unnamed protein product [Parnassius apollo]